MSLSSIFMVQCCHMGEKWTSTVRSDGAGLGPLLFLRVQWKNCFSSFFLLLLPSSLGSSHVGALFSAGKSTRHLPPHTLIYTHTHLHSGSTILAPVSFEVHVSLSAVWLWAIVYQLGLEKSSQQLQPENFRQAGQLLKQSGPICFSPRVEWKRKNLSVQWELCLFW